MYYGIHVKQQDELQGVLVSWSWDCCTKQLLQQFPWEVLLIGDAGSVADSVMTMMRLARLQVGARVTSGRCKCSAVVKGQVGGWYRYTKTGGSECVEVERNPELRQFPINL